MSGHLFISHFPVSVLVFTSSPLQFTLFRYLANCYYTLPVLSKDGRPIALRGALGQVSNGGVQLWGLNPCAILGQTLKKYPILGKSHNPR